MVYKKLTAFHPQKSVSFETCTIPLAPIDLDFRLQVQSLGNSQLLTTVTWTDFSACFEALLHPCFH